MNRRVAILALLLLLALPGAARAQIFLATRPQPQFEIGPLFVRAVVTPKLGPIPVSVTYSVAIPPGRTVPDVDQDLYLLWPGALAHQGGTPPDEALVRYVHDRAMKVTDAGRVEIAAIDLHGAPGQRRKPVDGGAPFVTFVRESVELGASTPGTLIRIPWDPRALNRAFLMRVSFKSTDVIKPKPATWVEHSLWGQRYRLSLSFNEVRQRSLFPLYLESRDRVVRLSEDPAQLIVDFTESDRLKIDELFPQSAKRQASEMRKNVDRVSVFVDRSEGLSPQTLTAQFGYFSGLQSWAPVLIPLAFFVAGNVGGVLLRTLAERLSKRWAGRVSFWSKRGEEMTRQSGVILDRETLASITPGTTTYEQVLELCGRTVEERTSLNAPDLKTLAYRGRRIVPRRRRVAGLLAAVTHWDVEDHEVEIEVGREVVRDVQARVKRSRLQGAEAPPA